MSEWVDAEIRVWIQCARCGRTDKPSARTRVPKDLAYEGVEKVCMRCERCEGHATMHLQLAVARLH